MVETHDARETNDFEDGDMVKVVIVEIGANFGDYLSVVGFRNVKVGFVDGIEGNDVVLVGNESIGIEIIKFCLPIGFEGVDIVNFFICFPNSAGEDGDAGNAVVSGDLDLSIVGRESGVGVFT